MPAADKETVNVALAAVALAPGLVFGSFLNVVAARLPLRKSIVRPSSACMSCGAAIAWYDNVPLVSYLALRGRCRSCGTRVSAVYPAVELVTALLVAGCVLRFGLTAQAALYAAFCAVLVANTVLEPGLQWILGALGASAFLLAAALAYPKGMGMGDVKLALLMGAALGKLVAVALMLGMLAALVPGVVLFARHGVAARKKAIPFAPFLSLGAVVGLFAGGALLDAYLGILG